MLFVDPGLIFTSMLKLSEPSDLCLFFNDANVQKKKNDLPNFLTFTFKKNKE